MFEKNLSRLAILKAVKEIKKKEKENEKKMGKNSYEVKALDVELEKLASRRKEDKETEYAMMDQISSLTEQVQGLMDAIQALRKELTEVKNTCCCKGEKKNVAFKFTKCKDCEKNKKFCNHCSLCRSSDHKRRDCT